MNRLTGADKVLCAIYAALAVVALVWTQVLLVDHLRNGEGGLLDNLTPNAAATFAVVDLLAVALVGVVFIVVEGRRLGVRLWGIYVVLSFAVAISVALPLFLIARQVTLASQREAAPV